MKIKITMSKKIYVPKKSFFVQKIIKFWVKEKKKTKKSDPSEYQESVVSWVYFGVLTFTLRQLEWMTDI